MSWVLFLYRIALVTRADVDPVYLVCIVYDKKKQIQILRGFRNTPVSIVHVFY